MDEEDLIVPTLLHPSFLILSGYHSPCSLVYVQSSTEYVLCTKYNQDL
jgi:hypothetical protein